MKLKYLYSGFRDYKLIGIVYLIQFVLVLTIGLQVYQVFEASIGQSMSVEKLRIGDAHMVINDLINVHGASLSPLLGQIRWMILIYFIIAAYVHGGIWYCISKQASGILFWIGGATYFFRFLAIGIFYTLLFVICSGLVWGPYLSKVRVWMEAWPSEAPILWIGAGLLTLTFIFGYILFIASSTSKIEIIKNDRGIISSIKLGLKKMFSISLRRFSTLFIFFLALLIIYLLHSLVDEWSLFRSTIGVIFLFILQQIIVLLKIGLRIGSYQYLFDSYNSNTILR